MPAREAILEGEQIRESSSPIPKATVLNRFIAKSLDLLIVLGIGEIAPPYGLWAGLWYILVADGFAGRSIGKRLIGLQAWVPALHIGAGFKNSIVRNIPLAAGYLAWQIPFVGWLATLAVLGVEALLILGNERGLRIGDEMAHTQVIDENIFDVDARA